MVMTGSCVLLSSCLVLKTMVSFKLTPPPPPRHDVMTWIRFPLEFKFFSTVP